MPVDVKVPSVGESVTEVTIANWVKKEGDYAEMDDVLCEIESDKASFELNAEEDGVLHIEVEEGKTVQVGDKVATIDTEAEAPEGRQQEEETQEKPEAKSAASVTQPKEQEESQNYATGTPSPAAKKIMDEEGIKPEQVEGTGKDGRITKEDAQKAVAQKSAPKEAPSKSPEPQTDGKKQEKPPEPPKPQIQDGSRETTTENMSTLRKTIARKLVSAKNDTAMLTTFNEVDMSYLMEVRKKYKDSFQEKYDVNLGFMSFFAKAICQAMKEFSSVNAIIDGEEVKYHHYVDLGIAVSTPRGLVVPVIRNAESMSFADLEKSVIYFAQKARDNKITIDEMQGGTFSITNGGVFGSMLSTPILNPPQSAILGMHRIVERPVAVNGEVKIRPIMYIALSYDHRIVDGKESVSFLYRVKELVEDPNRLLLEV